LREEYQLNILYQLNADYRMDVGNNCEDVISLLPFQLIQSVS